jgi:hypothetical protein
MKALKYLRVCFDFAPLVLFVIAVAGLSGTSCASIISGSSYPVDFNSSPQGAELTIENRDGRVVFLGRTPVTVELESSAGYMRAENYRVTYRQPGAEPVTTRINATINGWYFGNLFLGGLIGMLLVDPLTGAMYQIPAGSEIVSVSAAPPLRAPEAPLRAPEVSETPGVSGVSGVSAPSATPAPAPVAPDEWTPLGE